MIEFTCAGCGMVGVYDQTEPDDFPPAELCPECKAQYPPSLLKAVLDPFDYALGLKNGAVIRFGSAVLNGAFVTLTRNGLSPEHMSDEIGYILDRGIDVRVSEILWCADAPDGS